MVWIPFNRAAMCTDCDTIFHISDHKECPACTSVVWVPLGSIIQACGEDAEKEAAESYKLREVKKPNIHHCNFEVVANWITCDKRAIWKHPRWPKGEYCERHKNMLERLWPEGWERI